MTRTTNVGQEVLINRFIDFMAIDRKKPLGWGEKSNYRQGLCFGFAVIHAYMAAINKLHWWQALLRELNRWDGRETSLQTRVNLPESESAQPQSLQSLFNRALNYVLFSHASAQKNHIESMKQTDFLDHKVSLFTHGHQTLQYSTSAAGWLLHRDWDALLDEDCFSQPALYVLSRGDHAVSLRFDKSSQKWCLYDSNDPEGERSFASKKHLISHTITTYGFALSLSIATWDNSTEVINKLKHVEKTYDAMLKRPDKIRQLISLDGFNLLARDAPRAMEKVIRSASKDPLIKRAIMNQLQIYDQSTFELFLLFCDVDPSLLSRSAKQLFSEVRRSNITWLPVITKRMTIEVANRVPAMLALSVEKKPDNIAALMTYAQKVLRQDFACMFKRYCTEHSKTLPVIIQQLVQHPGNNKILLSTLRVLLSQQNNQLLRGAFSALSRTQLVGLYEAVHDAISNTKSDFSPLCVGGGMFSSYGRSKEWKQLLSAIKQTLLTKLEQPSSQRVTTAEVHVLQSHRDAGGWLLGPTKSWKRIRHNRGLMPLPAS